MEKKQNVPALRFQGFSGEWEKTTVGKIFEVTRGETLAAPKTSPTQNPVMNYPVYSSQTKNNGLMGYYSEYLFENAITWTTDGANAGTVRFRKGKFYCTNVCGVLLSKQGYANTFMAEALNKVAWKHVSKVGNPKLMNNVMKEISIHAPKTIDEQNELAEYIEKLDLNIFNRMQKIRKLQQFRQAMLAKLFPREGAAEPELRFRGFSGKWKSQKMKDLGSFLKGKLYSKKNIQTSGVPLILYGRLYTQYELVIDEVDTFAVPYENSVWSIGGEVIVPASGETAEDIAIASVVKRKGILLGGDLNIIRPNDTVSSVFLALSISYGHIHNELAKRAQGKSIVHIHNSDLVQLDIRLPSIEEQKAIGDFFYQLDRYISLQQKKLERMQRLKAALLEKLFV